MIFLFNWVIFRFQVPCYFLVESYATLYPSSTSSDILHMVVRFNSLVLWDPSLSFAQILYTSLMFSPNPKINLLRLHGCTRWISLPAIFHDAPWSSNASVVFDAFLMSENRVVKKWWIQEGIVSIPWKLGHEKSFGTCLLVLFPRCLISDIQVRSSFSKTANWNQLNISWAAILCSGSVWKNRCFFSWIPFPGPPSLLAWALWKSRRSIFVTQGSYHVSPSQLHQVTTHLPIRQSKLRIP